MTINTRMVQLLLRQENSAYVPLENGLRLQILPDFSFLPQCQKHHFAAFIQKSAILLVWDDQPTHILSRVKDIEDQLMNMIWNHSAEDDQKFSPGFSDKGTRQTGGHIQEVKDVDGKDNEKMSEEPRKIVLIQSILTAITLTLIIAAVGTGVRRMMVEVKVDNNYLRLLLLLVAPLQIWLALVIPSPSPSFRLVTNMSSVLHAIFGYWNSPNNRACQPDEGKYQVLLRCGTASIV
jgi:hypothetical protein